MRRGAARTTGVISSLALLAAGIAIWAIAFRTPATDLLPLPDSLIALESPAGQELLARSHFVADYEKLNRNFEPQSRRAYCGVASATVILNAIRSPQPRVTQSSFFTAATSEVRSALQVTFAGMTLDELGGLLRAHGLEATIYHTTETTLESFRSIATQNLQLDQDFVLVNYERAVLGQIELGHISPLAGYSAATDRFLILDVATYKYPPVWVSTEELWRAMNTVDASSGRMRGFVVVREGRS
jgi:hypothetical protein